MMLALLFKAHVRGYTRANGTAVRAHEDARHGPQLALFMGRPPHTSVPASKQRVEAGGR